MIKKIDQFKVYICCAFVGLCCMVQASAHSPNEAGYHFDEASQTLTLHTTHQSLKEVLKLLLPDTKDQSTIDFRLYQSDFEKYFNEEISVCANDQELVFRISHMDLEGHDVMLHFTLQKTEAPWQSFIIEIEAFLPVYRKAYNTVKVVGTQIADVVVLSRNNTAAYIGTLL